MTAVEVRRLKALLKNAVTEVLAERQDLLRDALRESLEDMAILRAIQLGEKSPLISRKNVFRRLQRASGNQLKPFTEEERRLAYRTPNHEFDALEHHCASLPKRPSND